MNIGGMPMADDALIAEIHRLHEEIDKLRAENNRLLALIQELEYDIGSIIRYDSEG